MANSTIKFPQEMPPAATINGSDKIMIADAATNEAKSATWDSAKQYLNITGIELKPVPAGALPAGPAGQERKMQITEAGAWTYGGSSFVNPDGSVMILWWSGSTWSIADQYMLPTVQGTDALNPSGQNVPKEEAVADYVEPLFNLTTTSTNLINNNIVEAGAYRLTDGGKITTANAIRYPLTPIKQGQTHISIGGIGTNQAAAQAVFAFYSNANGTGYISGTNTKVGAVIPVGANYFGITFASETNIGVDPVNNPYKNTMQANYGSELLPYQPFSTMIDPDKIAGIQPIVSDELGNLSNRIDFLEEASQYEYKFPVGASVDGLNLLLNTDGDYLEFTSRIETLTSNNQLRMFGTPPTNINAFGFYLDNLRLRGNFANEAWTEFTGLPVLGDFNKFKLKVNGANWDLYVNDVLHQSKPKNSGLLISTIGNAYTQTLPFWLTGNVTIKAGGGVEIFKNFNQYNENIERISISEDKTAFADVLVSYEPTGYSGREKLTIYTRRPSNGNYVGINLIHQVIGNHGDVFRINEAFEYSYNGTSINQLGAIPTLTNGESEFTTQISGKTGHYGGAHGQELKSLIKVFIDGKEKPLDSAFNLIPCSSFFYIQKSNIVDNDTALTPLMEHYKRTDFAKGGYKTFNRVVGLKSPSLLMQYIYTGIVCIGRSNAEEAVDDYFNIADLGTVDGKLLDGTGDKELNFMGSSLSVQVSSKSIEESEHIMWIQDRVTIGDSKYYRINNSAVASTKPLMLGEKWESECVVSFM